MVTKLRDRTAGAVLLACMVPLAWSCAGPSVHDDDRLLAEARQRLDAGRPEQAVELLASGPPSGQPSPQWSLLLADAYGAQGRHRMALAELDEIELTWAAEADVERRRLLALRRLGEVSRAHDLVDAMLAKGPDASLWYEKGELLASMGRNDEAQAAWKSAREARPEWWMPYVAAAALHLKEESEIGRAEAAALLEQARAKAGESADVHFHLGLLEEQSGVAASALVHYRAALELDPVHSPSLRNAALLLEQEGRWREARAFIDRALEQEPPGALRDALQDRVTELTQKIAEADSRKTDSRR